MDKKYLVVCGDSFTEGHVMGEKIKMDLILIELDIE
jgi:hypothetical protein